MIQELSSSEALFGFMGWLTAREESITLGSSHDCSQIPGLITEFMKENNLPEPREGWDKILKRVP